jgi:hypothetical protein
MSKPAELIEWISNLYPITEPSTTRKTEGYAPKRLPASHLNWLLKTLTDWLTFIDGWSADNEDDTVNLHLRRSLRVGVEALTEALAIVPRILIPIYVGGGTATNDKTRLAQTDVGGIKVSIFVDRGPGIAIVANAEWDNATDLWTKHIGTSPAAMLHASHNGVTFLARDAADTGTWSDAAWSNALLSVIASAADLGVQFGRGIKLGTGLLATEANAIISRLDFDTFVGAGAATDKTRIARVNTGASLVEIWVDRGFNIEIVANATWSNATDLWTKHTNGTEAYLFRIGRGGFSFGVKASGEDTAWTNLFGAGAWTVESLSQHSSTTGIVIPLLFVTTIVAISGAIQAASNIKITAANPAVTAAFLNTLTAPLVLKSWARMITTSGTVTVQDGANVASITRSGNELTYTFPVGGEMASATSYAIEVTSEAQHAIVEVVSRLAGSFVFKLIAISTNTDLNLTSNNVALSIKVAGRQ